MKFPLFASLLVCCSLLGCSGPKFASETESTKGRELLKTVLESWKNGNSPDSLKQGPSPIIANDPDWKAGCQLKGYEIAPDDRRAGVDLLVSVKLQLVRPDGKQQDKKVNFAIGTGENTVVLRSE